MISHKRVWVRIAGHAGRIKEEGNFFHWRCYINRSLPEIPLGTWLISGVATLQNIIPGTDPKAGGELGLTAWIDCFGDITVSSDNIAMIRLQSPKL